MSIQTVTYNAGHPNSKKTLLVVSLCSEISCFLSLKFV